LELARIGNRTVACLDGQSCAIISKIEAKGNAARGGNDVKCKLPHKTKPKHGDDVAELALGEPEAVEGNGSNRGIRGILGSHASGDSSAEISRYGDNLSVRRVTGTRAGDHLPWACWSIVAGLYDLAAEAVARCGGLSQTSPNLVVG
jgi:hypothetical protein